MPRVLAAVTGVLSGLLLCVAPASAATGGWSVRSPLSADVAAAGLATTPPVNTVLPAIGGTIATGQILTTTTGTWNQSPTSYTYQWQEDSGSGFTNITGATTSTYTLLAADTGTSIRVVVTATNSLGGVSATSPAVGPVDAAVPTNDILPLVTGAAKRGQTLVASPGTWNPTGTSYAYQWQEDSGSGFANVTGATNPTYVLASADVGDTLRVVVTATNANGSTSATSLATATVQPVLPTATQSPTISGTAKRTFTLSATSGVWTPSGVTLAYQWERDSGSGWTAISGATTSRYTLATADVGARVRITVTGTDSDGSTAASSAATVTVIGAIPEVVTSPVVSGANQVGQTLTSSNGTWSPAATSYAYQWQRDAGAGFADIAGATSSSYAVVTADAGARLRLKVTATNAEGDGIGYSGATGLVTNPPTFTVAPTVPTGTLQDTGVLTADSGTVSPSTASLYFQWVRCPVGATTITGSCMAVGVTNTYKLTADDVGHPMGVRVTATTSGGSSTAVSPLTAAVTGRPLTNVALPQVTGTIEVADTAYAVAGQWNVPLKTTKYQWQRCDANGANCADIPGATADRYAISTADLAVQIAVRESVTSPGRSASATSIPVLVAPQPLPAATELPSVLGTTKRMWTLSATQGTWAYKPTRFSYQWQRCASDGTNCVDIVGARNPSYTLTEAEVGSAMTVVVSATNTSGTVTAMAAPTAPIQAVPPVNRLAPVVSGVMQAPNQLQAARALWDSTSDTRFTYQWQRCDSAGANCAAITGATAQSYKLSSADVDHTIRVAMTATNADGAVTATSAATVAILPPPPSPGVYPTLTIDGSPLQSGRTLTMSPATWFNATSTTPQFYRCAPRCVLLSTGGAWTYTISSADAGAILRGAEQAVGPGGTRIAYATRYFGPVPSGSMAMSLLSTGGSATLRTSSGTPLASASVGTTATAASVRAASAGTTVKVALRRLAGVRGGLRAWACATPVRDARQPCTKAVSLTRRATLKLALGHGQRARIVVTRRR